MKSIKFLLAALVISSMFASCAKEEMIVAPENQTNGFVGAELIGTDISVDFSADPTTKVTGGNWDAKDLLGLGWIVKTSYTTPQVETVAPDVNNIYANHMFQKGANGDLVSKGNIYKGWHFGYYPFKYMETLGSTEPILFEHNPKQTLKGGEDERKTTALHLTPLRFLSRELLDADYQFKTGVKMPMYNVYKTISVTINPTEDFTKSDALKDLKVTGIQIYAGDSQPVFACNGVTLYPNQLAQVVAKVDADGKVVKENGIVVLDEVKTKKAFYASLIGEDGKLDRTGSNGAIETDYHSSLSTTIANNEIKLNGPQTLRIHTLPTTIDLTSQKSVMDVKVFVEGGYFTVKYTDKPETQLTKAESDNNAAFDKLIANYKAKGHMSAYYDGNTALKAGIGLELTLTPDMFVADFTSIKSESEWNSAVKVADALGMKKATFTIAKTDDDKYWRFKDEDEDGNLVNLPEAELSVKGVTMILGAKGEWPAEGLTLKANLSILDTLVVNGTLSTASTKKITNKSVIIAGAESCIGKKADNNFDNVDGRVIVSYGAYVYPDAGKEGTIAYEVDRANYNDIKKINTMIEGGNLGTSANVNTLIVKTALDLNALEVAGVVDKDRYDDFSSSDSFLSSLANIDVELVGGSLQHSLLGPNTTVKHLVVESGVNSIDDIIVAEHIEVNEDAVLNVTNTVSNVHTSYFTQTIVNEGTMNLNNVCLNVETIDNETGTLVIATGSHIYYSAVDGFTQGGTVTGSVMPGVCDNLVVNNVDGLVNAIAKAEPGATVTLSDDMTLPSTINVDKKLVIDLNGKKLTNKKENTITDVIVVGATGDLTLEGDGSVEAVSGNDGYAIIAEGKLTIKGGTYSSGVDANELNNAVIYAKGNGEVYIEGGTFKVSEGTDTRYTLNKKDADKATTKFEVTGGRFYKYNPAESASENPVENFVKTGYKSTQSGDWYVVTKIN